MHGIITGKRTRSYRRLFAAPRAVTKTEQLAGRDGAGRFIGEHDLERAFRYFWSQPHRRNCAPKGYSGAYAS